MSVTIISIIYISIGLISFISIIIGILNIVKLTSTSSAIHELHNEIEKKIHEMDVLNRDVNGRALQNNSIQLSSSETHLQHVQTKIGNSNQQIEIVRNMRDNPATTVEHIPSHSILDSEIIQPDSQTAARNIPQPEQISKPPLSTTQHPSNNSPAYSTDNPGLRNNTTYDNTHFDDISNEQEEVIDVVPDQLDEDSLESPKSITIPLFSEKTKDADFQELWKRILPILEKNEYLCINIDLGNILFLYDKEIEYLNNIFTNTKLRQKELAFVHCGKELQSTLLNDPILRNLIQ